MRNGYWLRAGLRSGLEEKPPGWGPATLPPWKPFPLYLLAAVPLHVRLMSLEKSSITEHSMLDRQSHCFAERDVQTFLSLFIS
jgi:hypothetical protein